MTPALSGAACYTVDDFVYIIGGQNSSDLGTNLISKVQKSDPTSFEKAGYMQVPRIDPFAFTMNNKIVILGGTVKPVMEIFDEKTLKAETGHEDKSRAFFHQLACYTSDIKLENSTIG